MTPTMGMLKEGAEESKGENARMVSLQDNSGISWPGRTFHESQASFVGAVAIAELVKSTLGPKGMVGAA